MRLKLKDKHGIEINVGNKVLFKGNLYDIDVNPFNSRLVIDNDCGQEYLEYVHSECEVVSA
ncbi:hypothetical protein NSS71_08425 [Niallia sp. FSL W8-0951]|uniref:hypothetical protein n=1 Tax=Niallia sp. FSL W8-0951 TaxID=2954639 RepID=UPI0030F7CAB5